MRRLGIVVGLLVLLALPSPVSADDNLTALINAAFLPRAESFDLHDIAHQRAVEIATDFSHRGQRSGVAEVLAFNQGFADPVAHVVDQWLGSPDHNAILSDPAYTQIGCGSFTAADGTYYAACVLRATPVETPAQRPLPTPAPDPVTVLPNTAVRPKE